MRVIAKRPAVSILLTVACLFLWTGTRASAQQLVQNGGFETGDFSNWTLSGNVKGLNVVTTANCAHSGKYGVLAGPVATLGFISQNLPTVTGQSYLISLWLNSPDGQTPNEFLVSWNGNTIFDQTNMSATGWNNLQLPVIADGTNATLQFGFRNDPSYFGLDDISVVATNDSTAVYGAPSVSSWNNDVTSKINSTGFFPRVDGYLVSAGPTPTLAQLRQYRSVLVYSDHVFNNPVGLGNVLADYLDAGGGVVLAAFGFDSGYGIQGRIVSGGYLPLTLNSFTSGVDDTLVPVDLQHPILNGVNSFDGGSASYHDSPVSITSGANLVAQWSDGQPLVATKQLTFGQVVALNFYPPSSDVQSDFWNSETDGALLMGNALYWAGQNSVVPQSTPNITWNPPGAIEFGTALSSLQLDASCPLPGTFIYDPPLGTVLGAGSYNLSVTFVPNDLLDYTNATATVPFQVFKASPSVSWAAPAPIPYGLPLGSDQLDAIANTSGDFTYLPPAGTVLPPGTNSLFAGFTPYDFSDYNSEGIIVSLVVSPPTSDDDLYGHFLQISDNQNDYADPFSLFFINTLSISNPSLTDSRPGYVALDQYDQFDDQSSIGQTSFPSIPGGGTIELEVSGNANEFGNIFATVYEDALFTNNPAQAQDSQAIFAFFETSPPSGGVPGGGGTLSAPNLNPPPSLTNLVVSGPLTVYENSSATFTATAYFNNGSTDTNLSVTWSSSLFGITNGLLSARQVNNDTPVTIQGQLTLRGVTKLATLATTVIVVQPPQLQPLGLSLNPFRIQLSGTTGLRYALQSADSRSLGNNWITLATNQILSNGVVEFDDASAATNRAQFYRALLVP